jgi:hypothetical protein
MRADNSRDIMAAARRRAAATSTRAVTALHRMDKAGLPITFDALAKQARVSRSWLYNQPDLRAEIERLRARRTPPAPGRPVPDRQRASTPRCGGAWTQQPSGSSSWKPRTSSSARRSPWPSGTPSRRHPRQHPRHAEKETRRNHRTLLTTASRTPSSSNHGWSKQ